MRGSTSAPTARVLDVVELLSKSEHRQARFSDVARALDLTQGTTHAILKTLVDRGWATRDAATKTFSLGPALSLVAARLDAARPLVHVARDAARRLVDAIDMPASVIEAVFAELMITAFEVPTDNPVTAAAHERIDYAPPFGVAFAAWDTPEAQRAWVERGAGGDPDLARRLNDVLIGTRDRGYDVDWMTPALARAARAIGTLSANAIPAGMRPVIDQLRVELTSADLLTEEGADAPRTVATISAPVLGEDGHTRLILGVHPLRPMTFHDIEAAAEPLLAEASLLTDETLRKSRT